MRRPTLSNRSSIAACSALAAGVTAAVLLAAAPAGAATPAAPLHSLTPATVTATADSPARSASGSVAAGDPAVAADPQPVVVTFGNVLRATIGGPGRGFVLETGQAGLTWDSSIAGETRLKTIGSGWTWGAPYVDFTEGAAVYVPGHGVLPADPESKTGLSDSTLDVRFEQQSGRLPARAGVVGSQSYVATLQHPSTGATDYFDSRGNAIATVTPDGRIDRGFTMLQLDFVTDAAGQTSRVAYQGLPRVTHPDGTVATVVVSEQGGVSGIQTFNLDGTPRFLSSLTYAAGNDGFERITSVTSLAPGTGATLSTLGLLWANGAPGGVSNAVLDGKIVYSH